MKGKPLTILLLAFALAPMRLAAEENTTRYQVTDIGTLGGEASFACGLNDRAEITGNSTLVDGLQHAFLWRAGAMTDLGTLPGHDSSSATGINNAGQVSGTVFLSTVFGFDSVLWDDGEIIPLGTLGGSHAIALAINQRGQVTGAARTPTEDFHAYLWDEESGMTDLGGLPGYFASIGRGINNRGQVVGESAPPGLGSAFGHCGDGVDAVPPRGLSRAVLWGNDGTITDLGTLGGEWGGIAKGINAGGVVVGASSTTIGEKHAFLWRDGSMTDLGTLGGTFSGAYDINRHDRVVGMASTATGELHAVLWVRGRITDLNNLIPQDAGWILHQAYAINKAGQIAGTGTIGGQTHGFLLTPEHDAD